MINAIYTFVCDVCRKEETQTINGYIPKDGFVFQQPHSPNFNKVGNYHVCFECTHVAYGALKERLPK